MATLVKRSDKIPFFGVMGESGVVYYRMTGFTAVSVNKNPIEYTRRYIDEEFERSDIVGYSTSLEYGFDMFSDNPVHLDIASVADNEKLGDEAVRSIIIVDFSRPVTGGYMAVRRDFSIIPSTDGNGLGAYTYNGIMKTAGKKSFGTAISDDDWQSISFTEL